MPSAFDLTEFKYYPAIISLFDGAGSLVCEHSASLIDNAAFIAHIEQAEAEGKIAVFHHVDFEEIRVTHRDFFVPVIFSKCRFRGNVKLTSNQFFYKLFFHSVIVEGRLKFRMSSFYNGLSMLDCGLKDKVTFERSKFLPSYAKYDARESLNLPAVGNSFHGSNTVDFLGVDFLDSVTFVNSYFGCSMLFSHYNGRSTRFHEEGDFSCTSGEKEHFIVTTERMQIEDMAPKEIDLPLDKFHHLAFVAIEFFGELTFENRIFQKRTIFKDSIFHSAPKFHNAELHEDTDFRGADFRDTSSEGAERAYRTLKLMMDKTRARREEGMFFALEQKTILCSPLRASPNPFANRCRSVVDSFIQSSVFGRKRQLPKNPIFFEPDNVHYSGFYVSLTEKLISFFYFLLSNYGQSLKRPIVILLVLLLIIFPAIYMLCFGHTSLITHSWAVAYQVSFQQLFRPFEIYAVRYRASYVDAPILFYLLATFQGLTNLGLLMLFVLSVRGRFRMY